MSYEEWIEVNSLDEDYLTLKDVFEAAFELGYTEGLRSDFNLGDTDDGQ